MLQEVLLVGMVEWQGMKDACKVMKNYAVEIREVLSSKTAKAEGKIVEQASNQGVKGGEEEKEGFTKNSKTWAQVISNSVSVEKEHTTRGTTHKTKKSKKDKSGLQT